MLMPAAVYRTSVMLLHGSGCLADWCGWAAGQLAGWHVLELNRARGRRCGLLMLLAPSLAHVMQGGAATHSSQMCAASAAQTKTAQPGVWDKSECSQPALQSGAVQCMAACTCLAQCLPSAGKHASKRTAVARDGDGLVLHSRHCLHLVDVWPPTLATYCAVVWSD